MEKPYIKNGFGVREKKKKSWAEEALTIFRSRERQMRLSKRHQEGLNILSQVRGRKPTVGKCLQRRTGEASIGDVCAYAKPYWV